MADSTSGGTLPEAAASVLASTTNTVGGLIINVFAFDVTPFLYDDALIVRLRRASSRCLAVVHQAAGDRGKDVLLGTQRCMPSQGTRPAGGSGRYRPVTWTSHMVFSKFVEDQQQRPVGVLRLPPRTSPSLRLVSRVVRRNATDETVVATAQGGGGEVSSADAEDEILTAGLAAIVGRFASEMQGFIVEDDPPRRAAGGTLSSTAPMAAEGFSTATSLSLFRHQLSHLTALNACMCPDFAKALLLGPPTDAVPPPPRIEMLQVGFEACGLTISELLNIPRLFPNIRLLNLSSMAISDADLRVVISPASHGCRQLEVLQLAKTTISDSTLAVIAEATTLTSLDVRGTIVSDFSPLASLSKLTTLRLAVTRINDATMAVDLPLLPQLTELDVSGTTLTTLAPILQLTRLRRLEATGCDAVREWPAPSEWPPGMLLRRFMFDRFV